jgi:uncharacterized protein (TIGR04255 family)
LADGFVWVEETGHYADRFRARGLAAECPADLTDTPLRQPALPGSLRYGFLSGSLLAVALESTPHRHYSRAPIVEAILDFKIPRLEDDKVLLLAEVRRLLAEDYPDEVAADDDNDRLSNAFRSADGLRIIRPRLDGLAFSRLAPYDTWESFTDDARVAWAAYISVIRPTELTGFITRYINQLKIPFGVPLYRFFNVYPAMPDKDVLFDRMFLFTETTLVEPPGKLSVIMTPSDPVDETHFSMMLDNIFSFRVRDESVIWKNLDQIRKIKNDTFNAQLTDELKETLA